MDGSGGNNVDEPLKLHMMGVEVVIDANHSTVMDLSSVMRTSKANVWPFGIHLRVLLKSVH